MNTAEELLKECLEALEEWRQPRGTVALRGRIRDYLNTEKQYDALRDNYVAGLKSSMSKFAEDAEKLCEESKKTLETQEGDSNEHRR